MERYGTRTTVRKGLIRGLRVAYSVALAWHAHAHGTRSGCDGESEHLPTVPTCALAIPGLAEVAPVVTASGQHIRRRTGTDEQISPVCGDSLLVWEIVLGEMT